MPNFLIVGSPKCGTTSLAAWLAAHPEAYVAPEKEVNFFNRRDRWEAGLGWYAERFAGAGAAKAVGEATPGYLFGARTVERIASALPHARLIACLREPVARAHSHWHHWYHREALATCGFAEAVERELARGGDLGEGFNGYDPALDHFLAYGRYAEQLARLCEHFPREQVHVVLLDDLRDRPAETYAGVCRFLGIRDDVLPENLGSRENQANEFRPVFLWRALVRHRERLPLPIARWLAFHAFRGGVVELPPIDPALRARLTAHFAEPNAQLAAWLGRDLSSWEPADARPRVAA